MANFYEFFAGGGMAHAVLAKTGNVYSLMTSATKRRRYALQIGGQTIYALATWLR